MPDFDDLGIEPEFVWAALTYRRQPSRTATTTEPVNTNRDEIMTTSNTAPTGTRSADTAEVKRRVEEYGRGERISALEGIIEFAQWQIAALKAGNIPARPFLAAALSAAPGSGQELLRKHLSELGKAGGSKTSEAKRKANARNVRLRWARHPKTKANRRPAPGGTAKGVE